MKLKLFLLLLLVVSIPSFSQKYELGKVTVAELKEKSHAVDSSASAAILFKKGKTRFILDNDGRFTLNTEINFKIKIYKKDGLKYGDQQFQYYIGGMRSEVLKFSDAYTYNLENGKVVKTKLKAESEFDEKVNENWKKKKIVFPDVKVGSIIEFTYQLESIYFTKFNDWYFQSEIPTDYVEYKAYIPHYFEYNTLITGFEKISVKNEEITTAGFSEEKFTYTKENVPALKEERFVNNIDNYTSILKFELASVHYPGKAKENFSLDWDGVVTTIYENSDFGGQLKKDNYFENDLKLVIKDLYTNEQKTMAIFDYVKSRMTWDGKYNYYCKSGVKKAYQDKTGNVAELNLILVAMLRYAGIGANPVLLSTRSNGIAVYPNRAAFNYVIAAVEIENGLILLDATNKNAMPNILPERALNWVGRIIRQNGSSAEVDLSPNILSKKIVNVMAAVTPDGTVSGKVREQYYDYYAFTFRNNFGGLSEDAYLEKLEKKYNGIEIEAYKASNKTDLTKQIVEDYSFTHSGLSDKIADKIYINPMLFFTENENPFKQEKREYPVDFIFPNQDKYTISINLPEGYVVESIPAPLNLSMEEGLGNFSFNIVSNGNQIQLSALVSFNTSVIPANYYEMLKSFYKNVVEKNKEKIVLKKA